MAGYLKALPLQKVEIVVRKLVLFTGMKHVRVELI
jgi:hypothetical protein